MIYTAVATRTVSVTVSIMRRAALCALLGLCLLAGLSPRAGAVSASPLVVTRTADDTAPGSLRYAIAQAAGTGGTVTFAIPKTDPGYDSVANTDTIALFLGELDVTGSLTIAGPAAPAATVTVSGPRGRIGQSLTARVFSVTGGTVAFSNLTIANGSSFGSQMDVVDGAGILNTASLTLTGCLVTGSATMTGGGGGIANSGSGASLTMTGCTVSGNSSLGLTGASSGGGLFNSGTLTATGCLITNNFCEASPGGGGGLSNFGTATLNACTVSINNSADRPGGGIQNAATLTLNNCVITGNTSYGRGGGISNSGFLSLSACTISSNIVYFGGTGGGIQNAGTAQVTDCLVAGNTADLTGGLDNTGTLTLINSTFTGNNGGFSNSASGVGGLRSSPATLINDIFYFDFSGGPGKTAPSEVAAASGTTGPTVTYSDVQGGYAGAGNISLAPQFVRNPYTNSATDAGDEHLLLTSPAVHTGTNGNSVPLTDIEGTPRPAPPATPSMGAYEIAGSAGGFAAQGGFLVVGTQNASTGAQVVAKFLPGPTPAAGFTASVDTGDGSVVPGVIAPDPAATGVFQVTVSHTYAASGVFPITVVLSGPNGTPTATVTSTATIQPVLAALTFPASVPGGTVIPATVTLSGPALADTVVGLSSSDGVTVRLFRSVVVPAGSSSAPFLINTFRSHRTKSVTITATLGAATLTQGLTITGR